MAKSEALVLAMELAETLVDIKIELEEQLDVQIKVNSKLLKERNRAHGVLKEILELATSRDWGDVRALCEHGLGDLTGE